MSIKSTKRNARSIYQTKYVTIGKVLQNFKYLENEKSFWGEIKKLFSTFLKSFQLPKILSDQRAHLSLVFCCETCENLKITMENNCERLLLFLQILLSSEESKHLCQTLYVISARLKACTFIKKKKFSAAQVFSCEICESFEKTAAVAASKTLYRTTRFWNQRPIYFMKTKNTILNFKNLTQ